MAENTDSVIVDNISNRVYIIRGQQVMLDYDLAEIYGYEVKRLNEQAYHCGASSKDTGKKLCPIPLLPQ